MRWLHISSKIGTRLQRSFKLVIAFKQRQTKGLAGHSESRSFDWKSSPASSRASFQTAVSEFLLCWLNLVRKYTCKYIYTYIYIYIYVSICVCVYPYISFLRETATPMKTDLLGLTRLHWQTERNIVKPSKLGQVQDNPTTLHTYVYTHIYIYMNIYIHVHYFRLCIHIVYILIHIHIYMYICVGIRTCA